MNGMTHLTKVDIEKSLLQGTAVTWLDAGGKKAQLFLGDPKERRLFAFIRSSKTRTPTGLTDEFVTGLQSAYDATDDPASQIKSTSKSTLSDQWRLKSIETEGFGGINIWKGLPFHYDLNCESLLLEGPNGSGKSSLTGAILWALSGERPRDQSPASAHEPKPVYGTDDENLGEWPPLATYPATSHDLKTPPKVRVQLVFQNQTGSIAMLERVLANGKMTVNADAGLNIPSILVETGLLMPARLATIRFDEGRGRLTDAVQKLTGLDELIEIAALVEGLCHKTREYRSYKRRELAQALKDFESAINKARTELNPVGISVAKFVPLDTQDKQSSMALLGKTLSDKSNELTEVISGDLASTLDLSTPTTQNQVIAAIGRAREDIDNGLEALPFWQSMSAISSAFRERDTSNAVMTAIEVALASAEEALGLRDKAMKDSRFQLKALGANWHTHNKTGAVATCPLCDHTLDHDPTLVGELELLRTSGVAATRTFDDSMRRIASDLEAAVPATVRNLTSDVLTWKVRSKLVDGLRDQFVLKDRYAKILVHFSAMVDKALQIRPTADIKANGTAILAGPLTDLHTRVATLKHLLDLSTWFDEHAKDWMTWWNTLAQGNPLLQSDTGQSESLSQHIERLSDALDKAGPFRRSASEMRTAWSAGKTAATIQRELNRRDAIVDSLMPLKDLKVLCESVARQTIEGLSSSISDLLQQIHLTETLRFSKAKLDRREGLVVHGEFVPNLRINATLVANTSWLRAILWAFIFALRAEAVKQLKSDPMPFFVFDDPQATFDFQHRHRWAQYIASLQHGPSAAQLILTTYDETFLTLIKVDGVSGREATIVSAGPELGHVGLLEGAAITRDWECAKTLNTPKAGRDFLNAARIYIEGMLKLMLRGENIPQSTFVLGNCREKLRVLNEANGGVAPWNRTEFRKLVSQLDNTHSCIKHFEIAHHADGVHLGMAEATDAQKHLEGKLLPSLHNGFRLIRTHQLLHGGLKALHISSSSATLPEGYRGSVRNIPLRILGRAAALSDGQIADGRFDLNEYELAQHKKIVLAQHLAYRLTALTLEPVARPGDLLLVLESAEPSERSIVVALDKERILARRFEVAENLSDVAVLTAQAVNPYQIASPIVAQRASLVMRKVIGVLYDSAFQLESPTDDEICECGGESAFTSLTSDALGLVEVVGQSAEPHALNGQYLIVRKEVTGIEALKSLEGRPVIAGDSDGNRYFKRLRAEFGDRVVLESLDSGGEFGPVLLSLPGGLGNCLERVWPVAGVLFELPK
jgi:hypothetical protein